jgi:hypothetical protein
VMIDCLILESVNMWSYENEDVLVISGRDGEDVVLGLELKLESLVDFEASCFS